MIRQLEFPGSNCLAERIRISCTSRHPNSGFDSSTNATTPDPSNPLNTINVGKTRTDGVELSLAGEVTDRWQVSAGYTWQDAALDGNDFVVLAQVPEHQASL